MSKKIIHSQNDIHSPKLVNRLLERTQINDEDIVVEIGGGKGTISRALAETVDKVLVFEIDEERAEDVRARVRQYPNVRVSEHNFLQARLPKRYHVFANPPFQLTSRIMRKLFFSEGTPRPDNCYLIMQYEAARKYLLTKSNTSFLARLLHPDYRTYLFHDFATTDFDPPPRIRIVFLGIESRNEPKIASKMIPVYRDFVAFLYMHAQPNLTNALQKLFSKKQLQFVENIVGKVAKPSALSQRQVYDLFDTFITHSQKIDIMYRSYYKLLAQQAGIEKHYRTRKDPDWKEK